VVDVVEVVDELQSLIEENVDDPANREEIQVVRGSPGTVQQYPVVELHTGDTEKGQLSIGNVSQFQRQRIQATVRSADNNRFDEDNYKDVVDKVVEDIDRAVVNNQDRFTSLGEESLSLLPTSDAPNTGSPKVRTTDFILRRILD
jgi:hypothetical protein